MRLWMTMAFLLAVPLSLHALPSPGHAQTEISGSEPGEDAVLAAPRRSASDAATSLPGGTPGPTPGVGQDVDDEGPDILLLALITTGAVIGVAVVGLVLYLVRLRIGFWLHRPPPREGSEGVEHH